MNTMTTTISNNDDVIDSRQVIERIEELEALGTPEHPEPGEDAFTGLDQDEANELEALRRLAGEGEDSPDWAYGETLIRDSYFTDYAQELAEEIGAVPTDNKWPTYCIDWAWAARELQTDYIAVDFDGVTYWLRG